MRAALIPMKDFAGAKMRLADVLDRDARMELARAMLVDVIDACRDSGCFELIAVVSGDSEVFWQARESGAKPVAEPATLGGLNDSVTFGSRYLGRRAGASEIVILPADLPLVQGEDVRAVVDAMAGEGPRVVVVRARDNGTNALGLRPPEAIGFRYGIDSSDAHIAAAREAGVDVVVLENERLAFDVDAPADLEMLTSLPVAAATAGWLAARAGLAGGRT